MLLELVQAMLFDPSPLLQLRDIQPLQELRSNSDMLLKSTKQWLNTDHYQGLTVVYKRKKRKRNSLNYKQDSI